MIHELSTHLLQSTLFAMAAALLTLAYRKNRAKVRFWLWLTASLKFFVPFALLTSLGSHLGLEPVAQKIATPAVAFAVEYVTQPFPATVVLSAPTAPGGTDWLPIALVGLWACGLLAIVMMRLRIWLRIQAAVRASNPLDIAAAVEIRSAPGLVEPGVVGISRPILLLPEGIADRLTPSELETVLAHELCHVRRRDNLYASIHMIVEAIFWFHPLVWWIGARLLEERERACDEDVLSLGNQPRIYADAILNVCKLYVESPLVCVSGVTGANIKRRIEVIMTNRRVLGLNRAKKFMLAIAGVAAVAGPVAIGVLIGIGHVPVIHAQSPVIAPPPLQMDRPLVPMTTPGRTVIAQAVTPATTPAAPAASAVPAAPVVLYADRRLVALFFDLGTMTADEQSRARQAGIQFVQNDLKPTDLATVMVAGSGSVGVLQDFTADPVLLQAAIQKVSGGSGNSVDARLANIEMASRMLSGFPNKKALMYYSSGITQSGTDNQAALLNVINVAKQANVAIYPIDTGSGAAAIGAVASSGGRGGRGGQAVSRPPGVSEEEFTRRVTEAQAKFGSATNSMGRAYIRYGAPDQIDSPGSNTSQTWRYNYLDDFHGSAAFEFTESSPFAARIVFPPATGTFSGQPASNGQLTSLAEALKKETPSGGRAAEGNLIAALPGRHISLQIYPTAPGVAPAADRRFIPFSIPLDSLSGQIDIAGQLRKRLDAGVDGPMAAAIRDGVQASAGTFQSGFTVTPGSYALHVLVREQATGRMFGETINFDVK